MTTNDTTPINQYLKPLADYKWLVLGVSLTAIGLGILAGLAAPTSYGSQTTIVVYPISGDPTKALESDDSKVDIATEMRIATSQAVVAVVAEKLTDQSIELSESDIEDNVAASTTKESRILDISFSATTPEVAQAGANAFAESYLEFRANLANSNKLAAETTINARIAVLQERLAEVSVRLSPLDENSASAVILAVEESSIQGELVALQRALADLSTLTVDPTTVIDRAELPLYPQGLSFVQTVIGAIAGGLVLGVVAAYVLAAFASSNQLHNRRVADKQTPQLMESLHGVMNAIGSAAKPETVAPPTPAAPEPVAEPTPADEPIVAAEPTPAIEPLPQPTPAAEPTPAIEPTPLPQPTPAVEPTPVAVPPVAETATPIPESLNGTAAYEPETATGNPVEAEAAKILGETAAVLTGQDNLVDASITEAVTTQVENTEQSRRDWSTVEDPTQEIDEAQLLTSAEVQALSGQSPAVDETRQLVAKADMDDLIDRLQVLGTAGPVVGLSVGETGGASSLAVAFELAGELQSLGARVLLIDAAVEEPMLHSLLRLDPGPGLAEVLVGETSLQEAARSLIGIDGLDALTIGNVDAMTASAIGGQPFKRLLDEARTAYHLILVVSGMVHDNVTVPAIALNADGIILSTSRPAGDEANTELYNRLASLPIPTLDLISAISAAARLEEAIVATPGG